MTVHFKVKMAEQLFHAKCFWPEAELYSDCGSTHLLRLGKSFFHRILLLHTGYWSYWHYNATHNYWFTEGHSLALRCFLSAYCVLCKGLLYALWSLKCPHFMAEIFGRQAVSRGERYHRNMKTDGMSMERLPSTSPTHSHHTPTGL